MKEREMAERNKILELRIGSHLYGTNVPSSDEDFSGVFIADMSHYFGMESVSEVDLSVSKKEDGKNDSDAVDRKFYELRKFVKLAMENNPNIIEQLFATGSNIVYYNDIGTSLLNHASIFPWKGAKDKFLGYAISQKKKMYVKRANFIALERAVEVFEKHFDPRTYVAEHKEALMNAGFKCGQYNVGIGDIHIQNNILVKKAIEQLRDRVSKFGSRKGLVDEYGYDVKFAMHLVRLLMEGCELLETGGIKFPLTGSGLLLDIRRGKFSLAEIDEMVADYENELDEMEKRSHLPSKPRYDEINEMLIDIVSRNFGV